MKESVKAGVERILYVSYGHESLKVASSIQNHRLITALSSYYDIDILLRTKQKNNSIFSVESKDFSLLDRILYKLFPFLESVFSFDRLIWSYKAYQSIKDHLSHYSLVIIPYEPYTTRTLQKLIKKHSDTKVLTVLYDPYLDNIFFSQSGIGVFLRQSIERQIVEMSDSVVVNHNRMYVTFLERYPNASISMIPFCGKRVVLNNDNNREERTKFLIVHIGNIFGQRRIDYLNQTITELKYKKEKLSDSLEVHLYGSYCEGYEKVIEDHNDDVIIHKGYLAQENTDKVLAEADALLLIDPMDEKNYSYPSKLCEYFQYRKVIVAFSGKGTPSYNALKETNNIVHSKNEISEMVNDIQQLIDNGANIRTPQIYSTQFYPENIAKKYVELISSII